MAQTAKPEADKVVYAAKDTTDNAAELSRQATDKAAEVTREVAGQAENVVRSGLQSVRRTVDAAVEVEQQTARRAAEGTAEISQVLVELINAQTRHNVQTMTALAQAVDWETIIRVQSELMQQSLERVEKLTRCYFDASQTVLTSALSTTRDQARKAA